MKNIFKLSVSLFFNQILGSVAGGMCIILAVMLAGYGVAAQLLFLAITFPFFIYIEYRAAFKYGFHDPNRRNKPNDKSYLIKGAVAGFISIIPLIALIIFYFICVFTSKEYSSQLALIYTRIASMYYCWPMCNIFPNHIQAVVLSSIIPPIIIPWIGYIAGYKNYAVFDYVCKVLRIKPHV